MHTFGPSYFMSLSSPPSPPKPFKSYADLVGLLAARGMVIEDPVRAERKLSQVGYYRLSGYWYPCRMNDVDASGLTKKCPVSNAPIRLETFLPDTTFNNVFALYLFDKRLRLALLDAIERIEIHIRSVVAHEMGYHNPCAYADSSFIEPYYLKQYTDKNNVIRSPAWDTWSDKLSRKLSESKEECIVWHRKKNMLMPFWVIIEAWDFGMLSRYYKMLSKKYQLRIAGRLGCSQASELKSWLNEINIIRNRCAHHSRTWNQKNGNAISVKSISEPWVAHLDANACSRIYSIICIIWHLVQKIGPSSQWLRTVADIIDSKPTLPNCDYKAMGFPDDTGFPRSLFNLE